LFCGGVAGVVAQSCSYPLEVSFQWLNRSYTMASFSKPNLSVGFSVGYS
jgi:hypothetical protein